MLYYSWKYKPALKASFTGVGLLLIGLAVFCWSALEGWEFGLIYGITLPSLSAFTFVVLNARVNDASIDELQFISVNKPSVQILLQFTGMALIVLPFALATSASISYGLFRLMIASAEPIGSGHLFFANSLGTICILDCNGYHNRTLSGIPNRLNNSFLIHLH